MRRVWLLSLAMTGGALLLGWLAAGRFDLIGLLIVGPCCALLTGRWTRTMVTAIFAVGSAVAVAAASGYVVTTEHDAFIAAVALVGLACSIAAWLIERFVSGGGSA